MSDITPTLRMPAYALYTTMFCPENKRAESLHTPEMEENMANDCIKALVQTRLD